MAFFPRTFYDDSSSFTPLFRLLDDFDNYSRQGGTSAGQQGSKRVAFWQPKFDVRETGDNYELHGELPGLNKDNVHLEFTEPQTLVVRGRAERSYTSGTPPAGLLGQSDKAAAITQGGESHKASVEDANEGGKQSAAAEKSDKKNADQQQGVKYWLSERSVGEFSRTFNFPSPVEQDNVSASFKDGILNIIVPKAKKQGARRIAIN
ncbi:hypothetical protein C2857_007065 [Epichloe festucae Fl1]|uniref:SHSP domain-containing protein n=2 Tax=Epichloe festucae TaxID=35717 RepID=A0A7S9KTV0_EPIFF|nr:30 kDa heat shock protein [Epichloe festucae var. lolii]QPH02847.1 hypothetical protein C2857_007065 [Epichloe festucae Fl1]